CRGRTYVSHGHQAVRDPGGDEVAAVLLRVVLPGRDLSRPIKRSRPRAGAGDPDWLAVTHMCLGKRDVETRPRPLSGRRRLEIGVESARLACWGAQATS